MTGMTKWLLGIALVAGTLPAAANAQGPYGWGWGWVDGYGQGRVVSYNDDVPYFALHPPVYYSLDIVRRPMGPSPFAYPGYFVPGPVEVEVAAAPAMTSKVEPVTIDNNYFLARHGRGAEPVRTVAYVAPLSRDQAAKGAQLIINPFVKR